MQGNWDGFLGRVLAVVGAGSASMVATGCDTTSRDPPAREPEDEPPQDGGAKPPSKRDAAAPRNLDGGPVSARDSSLEDSAPPSPSTVSVSEAGVKTTRVSQTDPRFPQRSSNCPGYVVTSEFGVVPRSATTSCSAESIAEPTLHYVCVKAPETGGTCDQAYDHECVANEYAGGLISRANFVCGPLASTDAGCCYLLTGDSAVGRPLLVEGKVRRAQVETGTGWAVHTSPDVTHLDPETRRALADAYTREAIAEHASVASFARFALQCLSCGAPAELVRGAQQAALDEVAHAELAFGLAAAYGGTELRPGPLAVQGALDATLDPITVAESVAREGAVAETVSALILAAARDAAEDPAVRAILTRVAADELEHALLAWKYLRWAVDEDGEAMRVALTPIFASASAQVGFGSITRLPGDARAMRVHGYLSSSERRAVAERALTQVVARAAEALLSIAVPQQACA